MKYRKEVQQWATFLPTSPIPCSTSDIGIADEESLRLIPFIITHLLTLGEVGEVLGILSAATVNSLVNSWAMTGTDSDYAAAEAARRHTRPSLTTLKLINLCVAWLYTMNLYETVGAGEYWNGTCDGGERHCKCTNASFASPRHKGSSGDVC